MFYKRLCKVCKDVKDIFTNLYTCFWFEGLAHIIHQANTSCTLLSLQSIANVSHIFGNCKHYVGIQLMRIERVKLSEQVQ